MVVSHARAGALGTSASVFSVERESLKHPDRDPSAIALQALLRKLSPATRDMLWTVYDALLVSSQADRPFRFYSYINRLAIAAQLDKGSLSPYDVVKLRNLVAARLLVERRHALPVKTLRGVDGTELQLGAGMEFVYGIPAPILQVMIALRNPPPVQPVAPPKLQTLPELPTPRAAKPKRRPFDWTTKDCPIPGDEWRLTEGGEIEYREAHRSVLDRLLGWLP